MAAEEATGQAVSSLTHLDVRRLMKALDKIGVARLAVISIKKSIVDRIQDVYCCTEKSGPEHK
jgi:hypothetical protein